MISIGLHIAVYAMIITKHNHAMNEMNPDASENMFDNALIIPDPIGRPITIAQTPMSPFTNDLMRVLRSKSSAPVDMRNGITRTH